MGYQVDGKHYSRSVKFKGFKNEKLQINAHFSENGTHVISGSEDEWVYIWKVKNDYIPALNQKWNLLPTSKKGNESYERFKVPGSRKITCARFVSKATISSSPDVINCNTNKKTFVNDYDTASNRRSVDLYSNSFNGNCGRLSRIRKNSCNSVVPHPEAEANCRTRTSLTKRGKKNTKHGKEKVKEKYIDK